MEVLGDRRVYPPPGAVWHAAAVDPWTSAAAGTMAADGSIPSAGARARRCRRPPPVHHHHHQLALCPWSSSESNGTRTGRPGVRGKRPAGERGPPARRWCLVTTLIVHSNLTLLICGGADVTAIGAARVSRQQVNGSEMRWDDMIRQGGARSVAQCSPIKSSELTVASKECVQ